MPDAVRQVECTVPVLPVRDLSRSLAFYADTLGFTADWIGEQKLACSVSRDGCCVMLLQRNEWNGPAWVGSVFTMIHYSKAFAPKASKFIRSRETSAGPMR